MYLKEHLTKYLKNVSNINETYKSEQYYIYHRTKKENAIGIRDNGYRKKSVDAVRIESGNGIYAFANLSDVNKPYAKKMYGNYVVRFELYYWPFDITDKVTAMKETKEGIQKNRIYNIEYLGDVVVLVDLNIIKKISISKDNGKTWM